MNANNEPLNMSEVHCETFRRRCVDLIGRGYAMLDYKALQNMEEPTITGFLVQAVTTVMQAQDAPAWVDSYTIKDDPPVNMLGRYGKRRPRADLAFEWVRRGKRPVFWFEAKWVGAGKTSLASKNGYLGNEGIGCFLSGYYPIETGHAGMLAYIHSDDEVVWATKIQNKLAEIARQLKIRRLNGQVWRWDESHSQLRAFISVHDCSPSRGHLHVTHLLLRFC